MQLSRMNQQKTSLILLLLPGLLLMILITHIKNPVIPRQEKHKNKRRRDVEVIDWEKTPEGV